MHVENDNKKNDDDQQSSKQQKKQISISNELIASNGRKCSSDFVFISAFKHIQEEAFKFLKKKKIRGINNDEIQWIITVPAIWNDHAKHQMKQWAILAGLINKNIPNQCKIVYEPDCASLSIQYQMYRNKKKNSKKKRKRKRKNSRSNDEEMNEEYKYKESENETSTTDREMTESQFQGQDIDTTFKIGDKYILCDAGGGTVDIACHEILGQFGVKEILHPSGGKWGSCYIDDEYCKLLNSIFTGKWMMEFKQAQPNVYIEMRHNFQIAKQTFFTQNKEKKWYNVRLPTDFCSFLEEKIEEMNNETVEEIEDIVDNAKISGLSGLVTFEDEYLSIDISVWKAMFDHVINPIILHIQRLLNEPKLMRNCKYLCLVGGLSCSAYFQYKMIERFGYKSRYNLEIIIPKRPLLSVVEGAAYFGITKNYIKARVLKRTYGIKASFTESKARLHGVSKRDMQRNKIYIDYYNGYFVKNCFKVLGRKNNEIRNNQIVKYSCKRQPGCAVAKIAIICSDMQFPKMAHDGRVLAKLKLEFDDIEDLNDKKTMNVNCEFHFYDTVLKVIAYCQNAPHIKKQAEIMYVPEG